MVNVAWFDKTSIDFDLRKILREAGAAIDVCRLLVENLEGFDSDIAYAHVELVEKLLSRALAHAEHAKKTLSAYLPKT